MATVGIVYYSMYGSTFELAERIGAGVNDAGGRAELRRAPELLPPEVIEAQSLQPVIDRQSGVPEASVDELPSFDGIVFGSPTRYGGEVAQLRNLLDQTGALWASGALVGKAASSSTGSRPS